MPSANVPYALPLQMKFAFENRAKRLGALAIKLNGLALLAGNLSCLPAIGVDLKDNTTIAFKAHIRRFDFVV